jgi:hypothetical protein
MKKFYIAVALSVAMPTAIFAAEMTGTIRAIDKSHDSITLTDGKSFTLPEGIEAENLTVGEKIKVVYANKAGKLVATYIGAAK